MSDENYQNISIFNLEKNNEKCNEATEEKIIYDTSSKNRIQIYGNDMMTKYPKKMGNLIILCYYNNLPLLTIGPSYKFSLILLIMILLSVLLLNLLIYPYLKLSYLISGCIIHFTQVSSFLFTVLMDPGIPDRKCIVSREFVNSIEVNDLFEKTINEKYFVCEKCNIFVRKKKNAYHCEMCNICVESNLNLK